MYICVLYAAVGYAKLSVDLDPLRSACTMLIVCCSVLAGAGWSYEGETGE